MLRGHSRRPATAHTNAVGTLSCVPVVLTVLTPDLRVDRILEHIPADRAQTFAGPSGRFAPLLYRWDVDREEAESTLDTLDPAWREFITVRGRV
jgi:hypothetical protein